MQKVKYHGFDLKLSDPKGSEVTNHLDPDQASMAVFSDTMYTYTRDTHGGSKLITFSNI